MVNLRKCIFLVTNAPVLGLDLCKAGYALGMKYMDSLHKVGYPHRFEGVVVFVGQTHACICPCAPLQAKGVCDQEAADV